MNNLAPLFLRLGLSCEVAKNGKATLTGALPKLEQFRKTVWRSLRIDLRLYTSAKIDGVPQPGFPCIEVHPSNSTKVLGVRQ